MTPQELEKAEAVADKLRVAALEMADSCGTVIDLMTQLAQLGVMGGLISSTEYQNGMLGMKKMRESMISLAQTMEAL